MGIAVFKEHSFWLQIPSSTFYLNVRKVWKRSPKDLEQKRVLFGTSRCRFKPFVQVTDGNSPSFLDPFRIQHLLLSRKLTNVL